jgi:hypothetical protein
VGDIVGDPAALDALQSRVTEWWRTYQERLPSLVSTFIETSKVAPEPLNVAWPLSTNSRFIRTLWQFNELLKHHTLKAAVRRLQLTIRRTLRGV